jgi:hypothetical protein
MSKSDGSTADYYELPEGARELQDLISHRNLNAQDGEMFRAIYRKGRASHSDELRDARKVLFYAMAEVKRLEKLRGERESESLRAASFEPASAIDDESPRAQAIGQNGNDGLHYENAPSWDDAPEWANWLAQDFDGEWCWFEFAPYVDTTGEAWDNAGKSKDVPRESWSISHNFSWRNTLQSRPQKDAQ